jgi:uncharacterized protein
MIFGLIVFVVSTAGGAAAAVSGFGIGSVLTPIFASRLETRLAVAVVSIPHLVATSFRFFSLRQHVNKRVLINFGIFSAAGGLTGALLNSKANGPALSVIFGGLLVFAGLAGLTGFSERIHFGRKTAWVAGALSGLFGGLVGNQGGIRTAGVLGFDLPKKDLVATVTAVGLIVDVARVPVYIMTQANAMATVRDGMLIATIGVLLGTFVGVHLLRRIPEQIFRKVLSGAVAALGIYMLATATS